MQDWKEQSLIHFAPSVESGDHKNESTFLTQEPLEILKSGKISNQVPLIMGINAYEGAYRAIRKPISSVINLRLLNCSFQQLSCKTQQDSKL